MGSGSPSSEACTAAAAHATVQLLKVLVLEVLLLRLQVLRVLVLEVLLLGLQVLRVLVLELLNGRLRPPH